MKKSLKHVLNKKGCMKKSLKHVLNKKGCMKKSLKHTHSNGLIDSIHSFISIHSIDRS
jgi:hypothetical protein